MFSFENFLNCNHNTPLTALSVMAPVPISGLDVVDQLKKIFCVLRPGEHQELSYNLTLETPYDIVGVF